MKKLCYALSLMACAFTAVEAKDVVKQFSTAGFFQVEESPRKVFNFNNGWRFHKGDVKGAETASFDDSKWSSANLPHGLEILPENASGSVNYQGVAWYRKSFTVPQANVGARTIVYFESIMGKCQVYLNGKLIMENFGGYLPFCADITDDVNKSGENVIAVKADNSDDTKYLPGKNQTGLDFSYLGGIYRDSYLIQTSPIRVTFPEISDTVAGAGVFVITEAIGEDGKSAQLRIKTEVENCYTAPKTIKVTNIFEDADHKKVKDISTEFVLKPGEKKQLDGKMTVKGIKLWYPDTPNLNFVRTIVEVDGKVADSMLTRVGVRLFDMRGKDGLYINNKPCPSKLVGANRHQDYVYVGNALPNTGQYRDVKLLREGGCRIVRAGHYPLDPAFYDACDELGLLATTANPGWHFFNKKPAESKAFEGHLYNDTRRLVRRDRNVAAMLMWETALNETPEQPAYALSEMNKIAKAEYPYKGMYTVADYKEAKKGGLDMYYHGRDSDVCTFNREYGDGGEVDNWDSQNAVSRIKRGWGEIAMQKQSKRQAGALGSIYTGSKVQIGGAKWAGIDHQRGYHKDPFWGGLLNLYRLPKYHYFMYKSQYAPDYKVEGIETGPMVFLESELTQLSSPDFVIYSNCEEVRVTWLEKDLGTQKPYRKGEYSRLPNPPFVFKDAFNFYDVKKKYGKSVQDAEVVIEGLIDGKVVVKEVKKYAIVRAGLQVEVDSEGVQLTADGSDFVPIRAYVVDRYGTKKVVSDEYVYFEVEGPAEIIGGAFNHANPVKTEFGVATALLRSTLDAGKIKVTAHSNGLKSASVELKSVKPVLKSAYSKKYADASVKESTDGVKILTGSKEKLSTNVKVLQKELAEAKRALVGRDQEIMELNAQLTEAKSK